MRTALAAVLVLCATAAQAETLGTIDMTYNGWSSSDIVTLTWPAIDRYPAGNGQWAGGSQAVYAGMGNFTKISDTGLGEHFANGPVSFFCMDVHHNVLSGTQTYNIVRLTDKDQVGFNISGDRIAQTQMLYGQHYQQAITGGSAGAEAFSLALWELMNETGTQLDLRNGGFKVSEYDPAVINTANDWLANLNPNGPKLETYSLVSGSGQRFMMAAVPEPATVIQLVGLAGMGLGVFFYRRRRKA